MKEWKRYFGSQILNRGLDYYQSNAVSIQSSASSSINAIVMGSQEYNVCVNLENNEFFCDCPYYSREGNCKHIAALLYYIENNEDIMDRNDDEIPDLISSFTHSELVEFLYEELPKNQKLLNKLKLFKNHNIDDEYYLNMLRQSFDSSFKVLKFINEELIDLYEAKQYDIFFKLSRLIVDYAEEISREGQFNTSDEIIEKIEELIYRLEDKGIDNQVCKFLESIILECDDDSILDTFTEAYSRFGDIEELFDKHFTMM